MEDLTDSITAHSEYQLDSGGGHQAVSPMIVVCTIHYWHVGLKGEMKNKIECVQEGISSNPQNWVLQWVEWGWHWWDTWTENNSSGIRKAVGKGVVWLSKLSKITGKRAERLIPT